METSGRENLSSDARAAVDVLERVLLMNEAMPPRELKSHLKEAKAHIVSLDKKFDEAHRKLMELNMQDRP